METRVLTLFDDEDFYPKEEPKKKPKKEPISKAIESETITQQTEVQEPELNDEIVKPEEDILPEPEIEQETFHTIVEAIPTEEADVHTEMNSIKEIVDEPKNNLHGEEEQIDAIAVNTEAAQPTNEWVDDQNEALENDMTGVETSDELLLANDDFNQDAIPDIEAETKDDSELETNADDEELNKQILNELVQVDYTSLIHRDYPFDMNNASVVGKNATSPKEEFAPQEVGDEEEDNEVFEDVVPLPEWKLDKKYYTIGEVAHLFVVNTSHIRFWTNEFKLKPRTTRKGDRLYSPKDIAELRLIHHLVKEKKHTIKGAREKLKVQKNDVHSKLDLKDSLINLRDTLLKIKEQL